MVHDDLIAMIPVDHAMAIVKRWGRMSPPDLVDRLKTRLTGGYAGLTISQKTSDLGKLKPNR